jgi:hypothetical protein
VQELSLNLLDIAQNAVAARATLIEIEVSIDTAADRVDIVVRDNGCGMSEVQLAQADDPFYTTRTTRHVGLGIPFFKMAAQMAGGDMTIVSRLGEGTELRVWMRYSHIDRMPLGDMGATMSSLIGLNPDLDFVYRYQRDGRRWTLDTRRLRELMEGVSLAEPEVARFVREYVNENTAGIDAPAGDNTEG